MDRFGSERFGSDRFGPDRVGPVRIGSDRSGPDRSGSVRSGPDRSVRFGSVRIDRFGSVPKIPCRLPSVVSFTFSTSLSQLLCGGSLLALVTESTRAPRAPLWAPAPRLRSSQCASGRQQRVKTHS